MNFFNTCKENKKNLNQHKNGLITKLLQIKKEDVTKEEWLNCREEWNNKRVETPDEKNRRECEEMLEDIKEEKKIILEMTIKMMKVKEDVEEIIKNGKVDELNKSLEMIEKEYAKKSEINLLSSINQEVLETQQIPNKSEIELSINTGLNSDQIKQLEEWTSLKCSEVIFDSNVDNWTHHKSVLNEHIIGKKELVFLIEDTNGEKFGYYLNTEVIEKYYPNKVETDSKSFQFNLKSNGRLSGSMKFPIRDLRYGGYELYKTSHVYGNLIQLGEISLFKENNKNKSSCDQSEIKFNYHGLKNALCGKTYPEKFTPKRIVVIQMK